MMGEGGRFQRSMRMLAELAVSSAVSGKDEGRVKDTSSFQFVYWVNDGAVC